jgi:hypothetical protein
VYLDEEWLVFLCFNGFLSEGAEGRVYFCRKKLAEGQISAESFAVKVRATEIVFAARCHCHAGVHQQRQRRSHENEEASNSDGGHRPRQHP